QRPKVEGVEPSQHILVAAVQRTWLEAGGADTALHALTQRIILGSRNALQLQQLIELIVLAVNGIAMNEEYRPHRRCSDGEWSEHEDVGMVRAREHLRRTHVPLEQCQVSCGSQRPPAFELAVDSEARATG